MSGDFNTAEWMAKYRREVRADVEDTDVSNPLTKTPHGISHHARLVINCPNCKNRMSLCQLDSEIFSSTEVESECGHCGATIRAAMEWEVVPHLAQLEATVLHVPAPEQEAF